MTARICRIDGCENQALPQRTLCNACRGRIRRERHPKPTGWRVVDPHDLELLARDPRPAEGLTMLERRLLARLLTQQGASVREIAPIVGVKPRTVHRWRADDRAGHTPGGRVLPAFPGSDVEAAA